MRYLHSVLRIHMVGWRPGARDLTYRLRRARMMRWSSVRCPEVGRPRPCEPLLRQAFGAF
jgi:hypothetical protein